MISSSCSSSLSISLTGSTGDFFFYTSDFSNGAYLIKSQNVEIPMSFNHTFFTHRFPGCFSLCHCVWSHVTGLLHCLMLQVIVWGVCANSSESSGQPHVHCFRAQHDETIFYSNRSYEVSHISSISLDVVIAFC